MPDEHHVLGFFLEANLHGLDIVVRGHAVDLLCPFGRPQPRRQNFRCLACPQFLAMLNTIHREPQGEQKLRHPFDRLPPLVG